MVKTVGFKRKEKIESVSQVYMCTISTLLTKQLRLLDRTELEGLRLKEEP